MGITIEITVPAGTTSHFLTLRNHDEAFVYGTAIDTRIESGGIQFVYAGGAAESAIVENGGQEVISTGGQDSAALVFSGGALYDSGAASNTTVYSGGTVYVSAGTLYNADMQGGLYIGAGGLASATTIYSAGFDYISAGVASLTTVQAGGVETVVSGGTAYGTVVEGTELLSAGGTVSNLTVSEGGIADIGIGGLGYGIAVLSGGLEINSGGNASFDIVENGGQALLFSGGTDQQSVINGGGVEILSAGGSSVDATIHSGGAEIIASGGLAQNTVINNGGSLVLLPGGNATGIQGGVAISTGVVLVNPGSEADIFSALATGQTVQAGGNINVLAGGTALNTVVEGNGAAFAVMQVFSGGDAAGTIINSGGQEYVAQNAADTGAEVASAGYLYISGLGTAELLNTGAAMVVQNGGEVQDTIIEGGARQFVGPGGDAGNVTLAAGAVQLVSGGVAFASDLLAGASQYVDSGSTAIASVVAGVETLSAGAQGVGAEIAGGELVLSAGYAFTGGITFTGAGGVLSIDTAVMPATPISGFVTGDMIDLNQLTYTATDVPEVVTAGTLVVAPGVSLEIAGAINAGQFEILDHDGETEVTTDVPCFADGTRILTPEGYVAVELLSVGDGVITAAGEDAPVVWIGRRRIDLRAHPEPEKVQPVRIAAGSLGLGEPARDLLLSPDHGVLCEGVLVPAKALVNGVNINQINRASVTYFHVELASHSVIFAEGLAVESYLDTGNRGAFENGRRGAGGGQAMREGCSCAPLATAGALVVRTRQTAARRDSGKRFFFEKKNQKTFAGFSLGF